MNNKTRRFIAGAVCPGCGKMDKLMVSLTEQGTLQECVACSYSKLLEAEAPVEEPQVFFHAPSQEP